MSPWCGCSGCHDAAVAVVDHPDHGNRVVCETHADGLEVVADV